MPITPTASPKEKKKIFPDGWETKGIYAKIHKELTEQSEKKRKIKINDKIKIEITSDKDEIAKAYGTTEFHEWSKKITKKEAKALNKYSMDSYTLNTILRNEAKNIIVPTDNYEVWHRAKYNMPNYKVKIDDVNGKLRHELWLNYNEHWSKEQIAELKKDENAYIDSFVDWKINIDTKNRPSPKDSPQKKKEKETNKERLKYYKRDKAAPDYIPSIDNALKKSKTTFPMDVYRRINEYFYNSILEIKDSPLDLNELIVGKPQARNYIIEETKINKDVAKKLTAALKAKGSFVEPAFTSTSLNKDPSEIKNNGIYGRPSLIKIHVPAGIEGAYLGSRKLSFYHDQGMYDDNNNYKLTGYTSENEFLINKGYEFKYIDSKIKVDNGREYFYVKLEVIPGSNRPN